MTQEQYGLNSQTERFKKDISVSKAKRELTPVYGVDCLFYFLFPEFIFLLNKVLSDEKRINLIEDRKGEWHF